MGRPPTRSTTKGFHKSRGTKPYFTHLDLRDSLIVEDTAEELGLGQGTLLRMWIEEITRNNDFLRLFIKRAQDRPETEKYMKLSADYKLVNSKVNEKAELKTKGRRVRCKYCDQELWEFFLSEHLRRLCPKAPKLKALPAKVNKVMDTLPYAEVDL